MDILDELDFEIEHADAAARYRQRRRLERREFLDYRDPDALTEDEQTILDNLRGHEV